MAKIKNNTITLKHSCSMNTAYFVQINGRIYASDIRMLSICIWVRNIQEEQPTWSLIHFLIEAGERLHLQVEEESWGNIKLLTNSVAQEPESSSTHSQQLATGPYPEPVESNPHPQPISLRSILIPSYHLRLGLPSGLFPSGSPTKTLYNFLCHACHMPCPYLIRLDVICLMISGDEYKL
jgi:hypothetical protein